MERQELTLNQYQQKALETCLPSCENFAYMMLNLVAEVGEIAGKVAKHIRREKASIIADELITGIGCEQITPQELADLRKEAGDVLWQLSGLCHIMGWTLDDVAAENLSKLADRKLRNKIQGDGDSR